jgi:hypothetical protein
MDSWAGIFAPAGMLPDNDQWVGGPECLTFLKPNTVPALDPATQIAVNIEPATLNGVPRTGRTRRNTDKEIGLSLPVSSGVGSTSVRLG